MPSRNAALKPRNSILTQTIEIPQAGAPQVEPDVPKPDFWTYMQQLSAEDWKDHIVYLTRENPKTSIHGLGGYLTKLTEAFDQEDVKNAFGGNEFSYIMKRGTIPIYSGRFKVEAPPKLDPQRERDITAAGMTAPGDSRNDLVQQFITVLRDELTRTREAMQGQPNSGGGQVDAMKIITEASTRAMDVIKAQIPPATDPSKTLESLVNTAKNLGIFGQPQAEGEGILKTITTLKSLGLIGQPPPDPMQQLTMFITLFTKLDELRGGASGGTTDWKSMLVQKVGEHIPEIIREVRETREAGREIANTRLEAVRTQERVMKNLPPHPAAVSPGVRPAAATNMSAASGALPTVPLGEPGHPSGEVHAADGLDSGIGSPTSLEASPEFDKWLKGRMVAMIASGDDPEAIVDFLDVAKPGFANDLVIYPSEQVTAALSQDPILKDAVAHPRWPQVLARARAYIFEAAGTQVPVPTSTPLQN